MDGTAAIHNNLEALKRILAGLVAMAGIEPPSPPPCGRADAFELGEAAVIAKQPDPEKYAKLGGGCDAANTPPGGLTTADLPGEVKPAPTLPRHLRLAILRLLRPAEAAARRLIIAAARGLVVVLPPPRKPRPKPATAEPQFRRFGIAVVVSPADLARADATGEPLPLPARAP